MKFVWFTLVLAIINLTAGFWLSSILGWRRSVLGDPGTDISPTFAPAGDDPPTATTSEVAPDGAPAMETGPDTGERSEAIDRRAADGGAAIRTNEVSWDALATGLWKRADLYANTARTIDDRLRQAAHALSVGAVEAAIAEAKELVRSWLAESAADSERLLPMIAAMPGGRDVVGRFEIALLEAAAQAETSASNLNSVDCRSPLAAGQRLSQELAAVTRALQTCSQTLRELIDLVYRSRNVL